jgi:hypothetical protein
MHFQGKTVAKIVELHQCMVHEGWGAGVPRPEWNEGRVRRAIDAARTLGHGEPHLVSPVMAMFPGRPDRPQLPSIVCTARLVSMMPVKGFDQSTLVVVWFQNELALPIDPAVVAHLGALRWEDHAIEIQP